MFTLDNGQLAVELLDPVADRACFGVRYCTGGYIFQVRDPSHGDLLSGPTFPDSFNWFDGQGIPDAFNLAPIPVGGGDEQVLIIGVGLCNAAERRVSAFCDWTVERSTTRACFVTGQSVPGVAFTLRREVAIEGRTIRSSTSITNTGATPIPVRWFPHPFYPHPESDELLWTNAPLDWRDTEAYTQHGNGFIARRGWPWDAGHYHPLDHVATAPLVLLQRHPKLGLIGAATSYTPGFFPIWGNERTFSWEPFLERSVEPDQTLDWWVDYLF